jgi:hypothetical protein
MPANRFDISATQFGNCLGVLYISQTTGYTRVVAAPISFYPVTYGQRPPFLDAGAGASLSVTVQNLSTRKLEKIEITRCGPDGEDSLNQLAQMLRSELVADGIKPGKIQILPALDDLHAHPCIDARQKFVQQAHVAVNFLAY